MGARSLFHVTDLARQTVNLVVHRAKRVKKKRETYQPTPSRSLNSSSLRIELFNKLVQGSPSLFNLLEKLARGLSSLALGSQVLPEECVVDMA